MMTKKQYIQPKVETMVVPEEVLMDAIGGGLAGSPTGPSVGPAPARRSSGDVIE